MLMPRIYGKQFFDLTKPMINELKTVFDEIENDSSSITIKSYKQGLSILDLENSLIELYETNNEDERELQKKITVNARIMDINNLRSKYGVKSDNVRGKRYNRIVKDILKENSIQIVDAVLTTDKKRFAKNMKEMLPKSKRNKILVLPNVDNVVRKSSSIIKAADRGEIVMQSRRDDIRKIITKVMTENNITNKNGTVNKSITVKIEKELKSYFKSYTKNTPPYGVPKNLHTIAVTEGRYQINNVRLEYMKELHKTAGKDGFIMQKAWKHNISLSRESRENHESIVNQGWIDINDKFILIDSSGRSYEVETPHDIKLPPGEFIGCNCEVVYRMKKA
jgi:hypothetical protein